MPISFLGSVGIQCGTGCVDRPGDRRGIAVPLGGSDHVRCVVADEAQQGRAAGVLPWQAEEVQPWHVGDATAVQDPAVAQHAGDVDPGVVGPIAGRPDHDGDVPAAAVGEPRRAAGGRDQPRPEPDPRPLQVPTAAADEELATTSASAGPAGSPRSPASAPAESATRRGPGQAVAGAAPGRCCRATARPAGSTRALRRSGSRSCRHRRRAPGRPAGRPDCGSRRCAPGSPSCPVPPRGRDEGLVERAGRDDHLPGGVLPIRVSIRNPVSVECSPVTLASSSTGSAKVAA